MQAMQDYPGIPAVQVTELTKSFRGRASAKIDVLKRVSFSVAAGERVALVGASGSGKSTLLRNINGLQQADSGCIEIFGAPIQANGQVHSKVRKLRSRVGFIFQQFNLVNRLTVLENVLVGHLANVTPFRSACRWFSPAEKENALIALEQVGILNQAYKRASSLSGGQQQRVAIARCLMQKAEIILADEPIASLDPESARKIMDLLVALNRDHGITVITSLHQVQMVQRYFDRSIALQAGAIQFDGRTTDLTDGKLAQIYGSAVEELVRSGHSEVLVH